MEPLHSQSLLSPIAEEKDEDLETVISVVPQEPSCVHVANCLDRTSRWSCLATATLGTIAIIFALSLLNASPASKSLYKVEIGLVYAVAGCLGFTIVASIALKAIKAWNERR